MREILFRAKRKNWQEFPKEEWWVEGSYHHQTDYYGESCDKHYIIDGTETDMEGYGEHYEIDPETLCQYIGMVDRNGKRIWEDDIIKHEISDTLGTVKWYQEDYVGWCVDDVMIDEQQFTDEMWNECEVIGNAFDDKHLLDKSDYCREQEKETED